MDQIPQSYRRQQDKQGVKMEQRVAEGRWQGKGGKRLREISKKSVEKEVLVETFKDPNFSQCSPPKI